MDFIDLFFESPDEVVRRLCDRLRIERVAQSMTQGELAMRAGVSKATVSNIELGRSPRLDYIVRIAMALGRADELDKLFLPVLESIEDVNRYEATATRQRVRKKGQNA